MEKNDDDYNTLGSDCIHILDLMSGEVSQINFLAISDYTTDSRVYSDDMTVSKAEEIIGCYTQGQLFPVDLSDEKQIDTVNYVSRVGYSYHFPRENHMNMFLALIPKKFGQGFNKPFKSSSELQASGED